MLFLTFCAKKKSAKSVPAKVFFGGFCTVAEVKLLQFSRFDSNAIKGASFVNECCPHRPTLERQLPPFDLAEYAYESEHSDCPEPPRPPRHTTPAVPGNRACVTRVSHSHTPIKEKVTSVAQPCSSPSRQRALATVVKSDDKNRALRSSRHTCVCDPINRSVLTSAAESPLH